MSRESEQMRRIHREVGELPWDRIQQRLWEEIRELIQAQVQCLDAGGGAAQWTLTECGIRSTA